MKLIITLFISFFYFLWNSQLAYASHRVDHTLPSVDPCPSGTFAVLCSLSIIQGIPGLIFLFLIIAFLTALAFLVMGGIWWIMSEGDKAKLDTARGTVIAATLGLIFILLSFFLLNLFSQFIFGTSFADLLKFTPVPPTHFR